MGYSHQAHRPQDSRTPGLTRCRIRVKGLPWSTLHRPTRRLPAGGSGPRWNTSPEAQPRQRSRHYLSHRLSTAEALQLTGQNERARRLAAAGLRATGRTRATDARALAILARAAFDNGRVKRSARLFRKAHATAERAHDVELAATILLDTLECVADWMADTEASRLASQCARAAAFTGNPHLAVRHHVVAGELRSKARPCRAGGIPPADGRNVAPGKPEPVARGSPAPHTCDGARSAAGGYRRRTARAQGPGLRQAVGTRRDGRQRQR